MTVWKWLSMALLASMMLVACGKNTDEATPRVRVIGELSSPTPTSATLHATNTPPPTAFPSETPKPTAVSVRVARINDNIDVNNLQMLVKGAPAPAITLTDIDGQTYQLDELDGKVVIINFWTLGCGSCFYEFPFLQRAYETIPSDQLLILGVNVSDLAEQTRVLAQVLNIEFPMAVDPQAAIFAAHFGGGVVPTTFFIDQNGLVSDVVVGPMDMYNLSTRLTRLGLAGENLSPDNQP